jgi:Carboxypeptidase regulatory-like domain
VPTTTERDSNSAPETEQSNPPKPHVQKVLGFSGLDGSFRMDGVPAGDYLAIARMPGYVSPGTTSNSQATDDQLTRLLASVPTVHVRAGQVTDVELTLHRGAAISGRVHFADGSPMAGATVSWELADANIALESVRMAKTTPKQATMASLVGYFGKRDEVSTDEDGRYRIFGLSPGSYILSTIFVPQVPSAGQVLLSDGTSPDPDDVKKLFPEMTIAYAPGVFRRNLAKVVQIQGSEQVADVDIKLDPGGLHTVRGRVLAGEDRHVPGMAMVRLREEGGNVAKFVTTNGDGTFLIHDVPPGSYTLQVMGPPDEWGLDGTAPAGQGQHQYQLAKVSVVIDSSDVVVGDVVLVHLKPGETQDSPL